MNLFIWALRARSPPLSSIDDWTDGKFIISSKWELRFTEEYKIAVGAEAGVYHQERRKVTVLSFGRDTTIFQAKMIGILQRANEGLETGEGK